MGSWHAHAVRRIGARVAFVVDPDGGRAARLARRYDGAWANGDLDPAAIAREASVAHVCTPLETHDAIASALVEAGVHVLVEKPLAENAGTTSALVARAEERSVLLCPVHQFLFQRGFRQVLEQLPLLGPLRHVEFTACTAGATGGDEAAQDTLVADVLPHPLALLAALLGRPVASLDWLVERPAPGELRALAAAEETAVSILVSTHGRPTVNALRAIGERGSATVDLYHGFAVIQGGGVSRARKIAQPFAGAAKLAGTATTNLAWRLGRREPAYPGLRELVRAFYLAVAGEGPVPIPGEATIDVAAARDRLLG